MVHFSSSLCIAVYLHWNTITFSRVQSLIYAGAFRELKAIVITLRIFVALCTFVPT